MVSTNPDNQVEQTSRRNYLKGVGTLAGASSLTYFVGSTVSAHRERKEKIEKEKIEELFEQREAGELESFHSKLRDAGFDVSSSTHHFRISRGGFDIQKIKSENGGEDIIVSPDYPKNDLKMTVSLYEGYPRSMGDLEWEINLGAWEDGDPPDDLLTLGWSDEQYLYDGEKHSSDHELHSREATGAVWTYDDTDLDWYDSDEGYVTAILQQQGDCNTRKLYATFEHTWNDITITGIDFGSGGVTISYNSTTDYWRAFGEDEFGGTC